MLEIENLKFRYKNKEVLKNINLYIKHRDFLGIIGPNGSGKSTLLKNISRIVCPNKGVVYLDDRLLQEYNNRDLAKKMAVVPQDTTLNFNFNVYDIIMMGRNPYQNRWGNISEEDKKVVKEAMCLTDTYFLRDKNINNLSGGERQRVIIARALAQKPDLLLLDEPTSSLDINYQGEIFDLLTDLNQNLDLTIIVVSHDLNLSSQYCDELILLYEGEIFEAGTPEEVLTPQNIKAVYKTEVIIKENPLTDRPYVTLIPRDYQQKCNLPGHKERIHVIAGGGSGKELLKLLHRNGYRNVSCGVLNQGDRDWEVAKRLNMEVVEIPPFAYIDKKSMEKNKEMLKKADVILISKTPFGHGNLANLTVLTEINNNIPIFIIEPKNVEDRDYTGGKAIENFNKILSRENSHVVDKNNLIEKIEEVFDQ